MKMRLERASKKRYGQCHWSSITGEKDKFEKYTKRKMATYEAQLKR